MKLMIRSLESKETLRIQTPSTCSLQDLKAAIAEEISSLPETLHLSLNKKEDLDCSSPEESLQSLGITSGDFIYYTLCPNGFSGETLVHTPVMQEIPRFQASTIDPQSKTVKEPEISQLDVFDFNSKETLTLASNPQQLETLGFSEIVDETSNDLENMNFDDKSVVVGKSCSVTCFLSKVFTEDLGNEDGNRKLLIIAVHAIMLESGFVGFDAATEKKIDGFNLPQGWASMAYTVCLWYTLPSLVGSGYGAIETVAIKFQVLGKFVTVYGALTSKVSCSYRVCLDESRFLQSINFFRRNFDSTDATNVKDGASRSFHERKVFEFWKIVKDGLVLPLQKTGLAPPPCLMRLPTELKIRVLELLSGVDMAKVGCVCSELRYLSSNDDLWKQKFVEEFGLSDAKKIQGVSHWKEWFAASWEITRRSSSLVGFVLGKKPFFNKLRRFVFRAWAPKGTLEVTSVGNGVFLFVFSCDEDRTRVLEAGPWFFDLKPIILRPWSPSMKMGRPQIESLPIWVKLPGLPLHLWGEAMLSRIGSVIGRPLFTDRVTATRERLSYARICVEVCAKDPLPDSIEIQKLDGSFFSQEVEYEWRPLSCSRCLLFGQKEPHWQCYNPI